MVLTEDKEKKWGDEGCGNICKCQLCLYLIYQVLRTVVRLFYVIASDITVICLKWNKLTYLLNTIKKSKLLQVSFLLALLNEF